MDQDALQTIQSKFGPLSKIMNEMTCRLWCAAEAEALGHGGVTIVAKATGLSRNTITSALKEWEELKTKDPSEVTERQRRPGAGRKPITETQPEVKERLEKLVAPLTRGHPESPLRWTCKSTRQLADELNKQGIEIGDRKVADLLYELGYSLQANRKTNEGTSQHPDRNAQFEYINEQVIEFQKSSQPVISVDTKKKELIGDFRNGGKEWRPKGNPEKVQVHDFKYKDLGKVVPYGVYDMTANEGWVSVGTDHDTAEFAVQSIRQWWKSMGSRQYPDAQELLITADAGGSNASRSKLWKFELANLAKEIGLTIKVCHLPPGTSKWNKIEHRMFCHITQNWRGQPLLSQQTVVNLIANTTTRTGLKIKARLDNSSYEPGRKITQGQLDELNIKPARFHGEWNYQINP